MADSYPENYIVEVGYGYEYNNEHMFTRNRFIPYGAINLFVNERNRYSSFCTTFRYTSKDIDKSMMYGDLYFDFDNINDFEQVRKDALTVINFLDVVFQIKEEYLRIYYSGNKGVHIIVPASIIGIEPDNRLNEIYKHIATIAKGMSPFKTVDTQIYDNKRLFRIPNTVHEKSKLYKIPITTEELYNLPIEDIKEMAKQPRIINSIATPVYMPSANKRYKQMIEEYKIQEKETERNNRIKFKKKIDFVPPCIEYILKNGAVEGERNLTIACLSGFFKSYGKTLEETIEIISDWNDKNIKPTGTQEMTKTVKSIFQSEKQFGCTTLSSISKCNNSCKVFIKKEEKTRGYNNGRR